MKCHLYGIKVLRKKEKRKTNKKHIFSPVFWDWNFNSSCLEIYQLGDFHGITFESLYKLIFSILKKDFERCYVLDPALQITLKKSHLNYTFILVTFTTAMFLYSNLRQKSYWVLDQGKDFLFVLLWWFLWSAECETQKKKADISLHRPHISLSAICRHAMHSSTRNVIFITSLPQYWTLNSLLSPSPSRI